MFNMSMSSALLILLMSDLAVIDPSYHSNMDVKVSPFRDVISRIEGGYHTNSRCNKLSLGITISKHHSVSENLCPRFCDRSSPR
ncbi:hypothetical protein HOY80DRAFT_953306 [Tuber brumale]|nr:hypothetical protein HOY80DRAFT_953306 [Tuber brumale]